MAENVTVEAPEAIELVTSGSHRYLCVRMPEDFNRSHVKGAVNVPYYSSVSPEGKVKNPQFIDQVSELFSKDQNLIVGCNTGGRSSLATADLFNAGFKNVKNMGGGFKAWSKSGGLDESNA